MSEKVIGRIEGDRFVPIAVGEEGETLTVEAEVDRRMQQSDRVASRSRALEQLETIAHVTAALDVNALELDDLERLGEVSERLIDAWARGLRAVIGRSS